jgi:fatty acid desaturase
METQIVGTVIHELYDCNKNNAKTVRLYETNLIQTESVAAAVVVVLVVVVILVVVVLVVIGVVVLVVVVVVVVVVLVVMVVAVVIITFINAINKKHDKQDSITQPLVQYTNQRIKLHLFLDYYLN